MSENVELDKIKQSIKDLKNRVEEQAHVVGEKAKKVAQHAIHNSQEKVGQLKTVIKKKPLHAVGIAALVGVALGFLFKKRK